MFINILSKKINKIGLESYCYKNMVFVGVKILLFKLIQNFNKFIFQTWVVKLK